MVELYHLDEKDTIMVISNSGRNAVPVEMCIEAKKVGAKVIAMTNMKHSVSCESRHSSGKKMYELADKLVKEGIEPPIFKSSNVDGGGEHNEKMFEKYYGYWK